MSYHRINSVNLPREEGRPRRGRPRQAHPTSRLPTAERILDIAEKLFAERGYNGTSIRDITSEARVNLGAIPYHYGSKENLLEAIVARRASAMTGERMILFDRCERESRGAPLPVRAVLRAYFEPIFALARQPGGSRFLRIQNEISAERTPVSRRILAKYYDPSARRLLRLLARSTRKVEPDALLWRFNFILGAVTFTLVQRDRIRELSDHPAGADDLDRAQAELIEFVAKGFDA